MSDKKISDLNSASAIAGTEFVAIVQGGETKKVTFADFVSAIVKPTWVKVTKSYNDWQPDADTTNDIEIFDLPAGFEIIRNLIKHSQQFSGGTLNAASLTLGISGDLSKYMFSPFDVFQVVSNTNFSYNSSNSIENLTANTSIRGNLVVDNGTIDDLNQGTVDIYLLINKVI